MPPKKKQENPEYVGFELTTSTKNLDLDTITTTQRDPVTIQKFSEKVRLKFPVKSNLKVRLLKHYEKYFPSPLMLGMSPYQIGMKV